MSEPLPLATAMSRMAGVVATIEKNKKKSRLNRERRKGRKMRLRGLAAGGDSGGEQCAETAPRKREKSGISKVLASAVSLRQVCMKPSPTAATPDVFAVVTRGLSTKRLSCKDLEQFLANKLDLPYIRARLSAKKDKFLLSSCHEDEMLKLLAKQNARTPFGNLLLQSLKMDEERDFIKEKYLKCCAHAPSQSKFDFKTIKEKRRANLDEADIDIEVLKKKQRVGEVGKQKRMIVLDGSNIAKVFGKENGAPSVDLFEPRGIEVMIEHLQRLGCGEIAVILPETFKNQYSKKPSKDAKKHEILTKLTNRGFIKYSPVRKTGLGVFVPYDDRMILRLAMEKDALIVSHDQYRDLQHESIQNEKFLLGHVADFMFVGETVVMADEVSGYSAADYGFPTLVELLDADTPVPSMLPEQQKKLNKLILQMKKQTAPESNETVVN